MLFYCLSRGATPGTVGTVSTVPDFFDQDEFFLSFYSEYVNEFRLPYLIPYSIVKFTFRIHSRLLLFDAKVERQLCSIAIFYSNIFPSADAMESAKWRACVLACFACFTCAWRSLRAWRAP